MMPVAFGFFSKALDFVKSAGGGSFLGSAVGGLLGFSGQKDANTANRDISSARNQMEIIEAQKNREFQSAEAKRARKWEAYMSNTAVRRRMADMKVAGLNPILAAGTGGMSGGASNASPGIPAGSKANAHGTTVQNELSYLKDIASSAFSMMKTQADTDKAEADAQLAREKARVISPTAEIMDRIDKFIEKFGSNAAETKAEISKLVEGVEGTRKDILELYYYLKNAASHMFGDMSFEKFQNKFNIKLRAIERAKRR